MAIDARIALGVQPVQQQPNMLAQYAQVMGIKAAQQEMESNNAMRDLFSGGANFDDPEFQRRGYMANAKGFSELLGKRATTQKTEMESLGKEIELRRDALVNVNTPEDYLKWHETNHQGRMGNFFKSIGQTPNRESIMLELSKPGGLEKLKRDSALGATRLAQEFYNTERTRISAGPGYMNANLAREEFNLRQKQQAEIDAIAGGGTTTPTPSTTPMGGGGGGSGAGAGSSIMVNPQRPNALIQGTTPALSPNMLRPDAQAQPPAAAPTIAPPADIYERIDAIDREIAKYPINNPRSIPILQQLNQQRTQLLASAKQEFGGDVIDMTVPNPAKPGTFITVKGRRDQRGVYQPVQMGETPILYDLKPNSTSESISPGVARPAPRVGYKYNEAGEEVKIPQTGVPEGVRIKPGERWSEEKQMVEQIPGSAAFIEQQTKHGKDLGAIKTVQTTTKWGKDRIDTILDPKNKAGFENNFGGFSAYATKEFSGDTARVKSELDSLKSDLKERGLQLFRSGGSIGAMTEKEWPIVENMIASLNPRLDADDARDILRKIKVKFDNIESLAAEKYNDQWQNTQYHKPVETNRNAPANGGGIDTSNKFLQQ